MFCPAPCAMPHRALRSAAAAPQNLVQPKPDYFLPSRARYRPLRLTSCDAEKRRSGRPDSRRLVVGVRLASPFPASCQFTNRRNRTLFTSPSIKNIESVLDPPELINGSGMPVTGIRPTTIPTFTNT